MELNSSKNLSPGNPACGKIKATKTLWVRLGKGVGLAENGKK